MFYMKLKKVNDKTSAAKGYINIICQKIKPNKLFSQQMSKLYTSFTGPSKLQPRSQSYYIVKDDFIVNLKRGSASRPKKQENTQECIPYEIATSSLIIKKKRQILNKMKFRGNNNFYDLDQQISDNRHSLFRKLKVALGRSRLECTLKMQNPFENEKRGKSSSKFFNNQKSLEKMIYKVQPFWIKKSTKKNKTKSTTLTNS